MTGRGRASEVLVLMVLRVDGWTGGLAFSYISGALDLFTMSAGTSTFQNLICFGATCELRMDGCFNEK